MEITHFHKNLDEKEEREFNEYVDTKMDAIRNLLTKFSEDSVLLKISIEKFEKHDAYEVEFHLSLPSKSMVATEASHSINKAVDLSKDRLITQIKKHKAHLRKERSHQSIRTEQPEAVAEKVEV